MSTAPGAFAESLQDFFFDKEECCKFLDESSDTVQVLQQLFSSRNPAVRRIFAELSPEILEAARAGIQDAQLRILVTGQSQAGKSTIINALLGRDVLPTSSAPCAAVSTEISYGEFPMATLSFKPDIQHIPDGLCAEVVQHIRKYGGKNVPDLDVYADDLAAELATYLVLRTKGREEADYVAESPYSLCRVYLPLDICRNGAVIAESPGLESPDLDEAGVRAKLVRDAAAQADLLLYVLRVPRGSAGEDVSASVSAAVRLAEELAQDVTTTVLSVFVINQSGESGNSDQSGAENTEAEHADMLARLAAVSAYDRDGVFFLSARAASDAVCENNAAVFRRSDWQAFEAGLAEILLEPILKVKLEKLSDILVSLHGLYTECTRHPEKFSYADKTVNVNVLHFFSSNFKKIERALQEITETSARETDKYFEQLREILADAMKSVHRDVHSLLVHYAERQLRYDEASGEQLAEDVTAAIQNICTEEIDDKIVTLALHILRAISKAAEKNIAVIKNEAQLIAQQCNILSSCRKFNEREFVRKFLSKETVVDIDDSIAIAFENKILEHLESYGVIHAKDEAGLRTEEKIARLSDSLESATVLVDEIAIEIQGILKNYSDELCTYLSLRIGEPAEYVGNLLLKDRYRPAPAVLAEELLAGLAEELETVCSQGKELLTRL